MLKLQRYLRQLGVLSKLRNLQDVTFKQIEDMPIDYDIETDYLFRKGEDKGTEKIIRNMLKNGQLTTEQIANFTGVDLQEVVRIQAGMK